MMKNKTKKNIILTIGWIIVAMLVYAIIKAVISQ